MPTLKFTIKGVQFEYIAEEHEIVRFINGFLEKSTMFPIEPKQASREVSTTTPKTEAEELIDIPAPPDEEVIEYIISKPDFGHELFEVQKHFFGRTFSSRGITKRMYHRTARQLRLVRKQIEKQYNGKFTVTEGSEKGVKRFIFKAEQLIRFPPKPQANQS